MAQYEYKVIPAPTRGLKAKGVKTPEDRFARTLEGVMNDMASQGWEYQRAETLPSVERAGLTSTATNWRNILVFRRASEVHQEQHASHSDMGAVTAPRKEPVLASPELESSTSEKSSDIPVVEEDGKQAQVSASNPQEDDTTNYFKS